MQKTNLSKLKRNKFIRFIARPLIILKQAKSEYKNRKIKRYNELFSNVKEGSVVVTINDIPGKFEIDARSHILQRILINKSYEPEIVSIIRQSVVADKDAINIGANVGIFTIFLASLLKPGRKVLAIEPTPLAYKYLVNNTNRNNQADKVIIFNGVCADKPGSLTLNILEGKEEYSSLSTSIHQSNIKETILKVDVKAETADNLVTQFGLDPGLILMDVEGAEMKALTGAKAMLAKFKPLIISELTEAMLNQQGSSVKEVISFLQNLGYEVRDTLTGKEVIHPFSGNIMAAPKS